MKLSDYVADFLVQQKVKHVFGITGGAIVHIFDSIASNPDIQHICTLNEQGAAIAADAYSRITRNIGVAIATSGPGATNLVTGVCCSFYDSIPVLLITGQVPRSQLKKDSECRQIGFQETNIVTMFSSITKYSALVEDPEKIRYELEKAVHIARTGRPGPVLLDIPDDVQRAEIDASKLNGFIPGKSTVWAGLKKQVDAVVDLLEKAERPVIILGGGIKLAKADEKALDFAEKLRFPIALTWATKDILPHDHPRVIEGFGVSSERAGNFAVQNSDLVLALATRLDTHEAGSNFSTFAREAKKVVLDIDKSELDKFGKLGMDVDILINCNIHDFLDEIQKRNIKVKDVSDWIKRIDEWKSRYPICPREYFDEKEYINPYVFMDTLSKESKQGDIVITDAGANLTWTMQSYRVKKGQRLFSAFNHSPMGYSLPAAFGASLAAKKPVICIIGDGGIQMNIQELASIKYHNLPIHIFVFNNNGYGIMQQTQDTWLGSRYVASNPDSGVPIPDFIEIAKAYGIPTLVIKNHQELRQGIRKTLDHTSGPILCNVRIEQHYKIKPKLEFGKPIEDSSPLLDRKEFLQNMIVEPLDK
ncbi:thiamine pyrophosphate-binding protein [Thermoproteota archaeon]